MVLGRFAEVFRCWGVGRGVTDMDVRPPLQNIKKMLTIIFSTFALALLNIIGSKCNIQVLKGSYADRVPFKIYICKANIYTFFILFLAWQLSFNSILLRCIM